MNLRGRTGATVLAITRTHGGVLVPTADERLRAGDVLAVAGTHEAIEAARAALLDHRYGFSRAQRKVVIALYSRSVTPDLPSDLQSAVAQRYELRRVLGRGGMATVYLAYDGKHRREVALKVLLPGLAAFLGVERFLKEIQIAAGLTHPHILALHDSGEAGGFLYYVMPYLEGGSLRQRLAGGRRLRIGEALAIAAPVADALSYAHRMGVFHRDIKPENVLFSQGHPIVADFGIAKAISTAGGANLTRTGFPVGTPGYMSPEQAAGLTDLDERTDVYSLAVVIYEMVVGEVPGRWPTEEAVRTGRFLEASAVHRTRLTEVGSGAEAALVRGLAIRHDQRAPTPAALIDDLTGAGGPRRRYSGGEVQEIVKRATELEVGERRDDDRRRRGPGGRSGHRARHRPRGSGLAPPVGRRVGRLGSASHPVEPLDRRSDADRGRAHRRRRGPRERVLGHGR